MKPIRAVFVKWKDSHDLSGWVDIEDGRIEADVYIHSIGILIKETEEYIVLSDSVCVEHENARAPITIPKECVKSMTTVHTLELEQ